MVKRSLWKGVFCFKGVLLEKGGMFFGETAVRSYVLTSQLSAGLIRLTNTHDEKEERGIRLVPSRVGYRLSSFILSKKGGAIHNIDSSKKKGGKGKK